jgi:hypothetical protein
MKRVTVFVTQKIEHTVVIDLQDDEVDDFVCSLNEIDISDYCNHWTVDTDDFEIDDFEIDDIKEE